MKSFAQLRKNLKKINKSKPLKIAILGDSATQFLTQAIKGTGIDNDINFDVFEADFNQIERQVYDLSSELYKFEPEIVIVFQSSHKLLLKYNKINPEEHSLLASNEMSKIENIYSNLSSNLEAKVIYYNYTEIDDAVFGNYANKVESSFLFQVRKLNYELMCFASKNANLYLCDISTIQNQIGKLNFFQPSVYVNTDMVISIDALPKIASKTIDIISTLNGKF